MQQWWDDNGLDKQRYLLHGERVLISERENYDALKGV